MKLLVRVAMGLLAAMALALTAARPAMAGPLDVLSQGDAILYAAAFKSAGQGDFGAVDADLEMVKNDGLAGHVLYIKLMHPGDYTASYGELTGWLAAFGDLPGADRVYALAMKRKPTGADSPSPPSYLILLRAVAPSDPAPVVRSGGNERGLAARQAYYSGDLSKALLLAPASGQRWIAGLASYRLGRFEEARGWFQAVANDAGEDEWVRSGAAFWAARAALALGDKDGAEPLLRLAASWPHTFYGMIAERRLTLNARGPAEAVATLQPAAYVTSATAPAPDDSALRLIRADRRAWRAAALAQIGRHDEAAMELRAGLAAARTDPERQSWMSLAQALCGQGAATNPLLTPAVSISRRPSVSESYPTPELFPVGGFTLDRALVYAITRQESGFNPFAVSHAGAMGLMQVLPTAAARAAGDDQLLADPMPLMDGPTNLRIGQDHFTWLMDKLVGYDLLAAIASYNCGPAPVMKLQKALGRDDSLLLIESLPAPETRDYVEHVAVAYWTYRRLFGHESPTLDGLATGKTTADMRQDH